MTTNYREVKRKAAVGERIRIVKPRMAMGYTSGDEGVVVFILNGPGVRAELNGDTRPLFDTEYVVLEPLAPASTTPLPADPLYAAFRQLIVDNADAIRAILPELEGGITAPGVTVDNAGGVKATGVSVIKPTLTRAQVIAKATADVAELTALAYRPYAPGIEESALPPALRVNGPLTFEFVVKRDERKVTAIGRIKYFPDNVSRVGRSKCSPADVFHAEIGKAIALRKALGLTVPSEYTDAPQPEKAEVGARVTDDLGTGVVTSYEGRSGINVNGGPENGGFWTFRNGECGATVIDDTDVDYGAETAKLSAA